MKIKAIVTGSTGMVGEGVLHECLLHPEVEAVLVINRRPCGVKHPKLTEIIHQDFFDFSPIESYLSGYNAAYLCLGVSSLGMNEAIYTHFTYNLTMHVASTLSRLNPDMSICYITGIGCDSSETKGVMWARVKGKTENALLSLPFRSAYMFRPGYIQPTKGLKHAYKMYKILTPIYPTLRKLFPKYVCSLEEIGRAMINSTLKGYKKPIIEIKDIVELAKIE